LTWNTEYFDESTLTELLKKDTIPSLQKSKEFNLSEDDLLLTISADMLDKIDANCKIQLSYSEDYDDVSDYIEQFEAGIDGKVTSAVMWKYNDTEDILNTLAGEELGLTDTELQFVGKRSFLNLPVWFSTHYEPTSYAAFSSTCFVRCVYPEPEDFSGDCMVTVTLEDEFCSIAIAIVSDGNGHLLVSAAPSPVWDMLDNVSFMSLFGGLEYGYQDRLQELR
jgi:hypothetical protein